REDGMGDRSVVAVDIGGTNTRVALFADAARSTVSLSLGPCPTEERYERQLDQLTKDISTITHGMSLHRPAGDTVTNDAGNQTNGISIGVSIGARLAHDGARVAVAPNLRDYEGRPFARDLAERCGMPVALVRLAHDPVCGLLAERRFGALRNADRCAYVTV